MYLVCLEHVGGAACGSVHGRALRIHVLVCTCVPTVLSIQFRVQVCLMCVLVMCSQLCSCLPFNDVFSTLWERSCTPAHPYGNGLSCLFSVHQHAWSVVCHVWCVVDLSCLVCGSMRGAGSVVGGVSPAGGGQGRVSRGQSCRGGGGRGKPCRGRGQPVGGEVNPVGEGSVL